MKVKCQRSAPPSHPPSVKAFGTSTRSCCGTLGPKLGKARKIRSPLVIRTNVETALSQWQKRTAQGCSKAARTSSAARSSPTPRGISTSAAFPAWGGPGSKLADEHVRAASFGEGPGATGSGPGDAEALAEGKALPAVACSGLAAS